MPSKRSRAWKQRKLAAEAEARLKGEYHVWEPPAGFEELKKEYAAMKMKYPYTASDVRVTMRAGDQEIEFSDVHKLDYEPGPAPDVADAVARLDGSFREPAEVQKGHRRDWEMGSWGAGSPFSRTPRLDGRRRK